MPTAASTHAPSAEAAGSSRPDRASPGSGRIPLWAGLAVFAAMFAYSWFGDHRQYVADDAGFSLRYAERIAAGKGFNYNDGEKINGASNPVFVLTEAALLRLGLTPERTILLIASVCLAGTAAILLSTFARFYSLGAALFSILALLAFRWPFEAIADGMETPIVMLLAALLFRALHSEGFLFPGLVLGMLVANKLDGALAAVAYVAIHALARRRFPWRAAAIAVLAAAPTFTVLLANFGSILPNSMMVKMLLHSRSHGVDHAWMHKLLTADGFSVLYWGAWSSLLWWPLSRKLDGSFAVAVIQLWFVLHMMAFSVIDFGASYPWYSAAPSIHSVILCTFVVHILSSAVFARSHDLRLDWSPAGLPRRMWPVSLVVLAVFGWLRFPSLSARLHRPPSPHLSASWDLSRQSAGAWLRKHTTGTELFATYEGLPAFEYAGPCYDFSFLNSARDDGRRRSAAYQLHGPKPLEGSDLPMDEPGTGRKLVATFRYDPADSFYLLYATPESEVYSGGSRHLLFPTPALRVGSPGSQSPQPAVQNGNTWFLPTTAPARFEVHSPGPPTVTFTAAVRRAGRLPAVSGDRVLLTVRADGILIYTGEIVAGVAPEGVRGTAARRSETNAYAFEIECHRIGSVESRELLVEAGEWVVRYGEPLEAKDFKLSSQRFRDLVDYVASAGLPRRTSGW